MAATPVSEATDGPVLNVINKRLRALRKKYNRIVQMEDSVSQGKALNKEQEDVLKSKTHIIAAIDELEKLRPQISIALREELESNTVLSSSVSAPSQAPEPAETENEESSPIGDEGLMDLLNLVYFGALFDVKSQGEFASIMLTRTHERGSCLTYDYVTDDDASDLLGEKDLDSISRLGSFVTSRPVDSSFSHRNALEKCLEHAKLWISKSDSPIEPNSSITYVGLREKLNKIMASDYFTTTPRMTPPVEVAAEAGNFVPFQVPVMSVAVPVQGDESAAEVEQEEEDEAEYQAHEADPAELTPKEEFQKDEADTENPVDAEAAQPDQVEQQDAEAELNHRERESRDQQYMPRRTYQNHRGSGRGGGRRGYFNGRGGRSGGRGGGGYQNGRGQFYDQPGNYYPRNYYNNRGRGGRGGGYSYNNHGSSFQGGHAADVGVAS